MKMASKIPKNDTTIRVVLRNHWEAPHKEEERRDKITTIQGMLMEKSERRYVSISEAVCYALDAYDYKII